MQKNIGVFFCVSNCFWSPKKVISKKGDHFKGARHGAAMKKQSNILLRGPLFEVFRVGRCSSSIRSVLKLSLSIIVLASVASVITCNTRLISQ